MAQVIQLRRDTAANWAANDPTPAEGEMCYESDTDKLKIGDGVNAYSVLAYFSGTAGAGDMTKAVYDPALIAEQLVGLTAIQTLTNKTLASPVLNTQVTGTAVLDEDDMASDSNTQIATQQSIKAYVDANIPVPPGADTQVVFNDGGAFAAEAGMTYAKATDVLSLAGGVDTPVVRNAGAISFYASGDTDDYIKFQTAANVPEITTSGACDLKITASSGTIDFDDDDITTTGDVGGATGSFTGDVSVGGKLTVTGLIDPTALVLDPQGAVPGTDDGTIYYDSGDDEFKFRENGVWSTLVSGSGDMTAAVYDPAAITEQLVGLTATQSLSNKSLVDATTFFIDDGDITKRMKFELSGITTGTTRTLTVPDASDTLVLLTEAQTLTNKTFTNAVLNGTATGTAVLDEDNMASDSDTHLATQQSIKAYVDSAGVGNLQQVFDVGQSITIGDTDNQTLLITNNDVTNNPTTESVVNNAAGHGLYVEQGAELNSARYALYVYSNIAQTTSDALAKIINDHASSTIPSLLVRNDGDAPAVENHGDFYWHDGVAYTEEYDAGDSGVIKIIDWNDGNNQKITLTADCSLPFNDPPGPAHLVLKMVQDGGGGNAPTWPGSLLWQDNIEPAWSDGGGDINILSIYYDGTNYYGTGVINLS